MRSAPRARGVSRFGTSAWQTGGAVLRIVITGIVQVRSRSTAMGLCPAGKAMRLSDIITPATVAVRVHLEDKPHALKFAASSLGARSGLDPERICQALAAREELGSTGIGKGVAVPHVCFSDLDRPYALLCTLASPIGFDAIDGKPVDVIFTIITPTG